MERTRCCRVADGQVTCYACVEQKLVQGKLTDPRVFGVGLEKVTQNVPPTTRNVTTVRRLVAKLGAQW